MQRVWRSISRTAWRAQIGSAHFIFEDEKNAYTDEIRKAERYKLRGLSTIYLAIDGEVAGVIGIEDPVREDAADVAKEVADITLRQERLTDLIWLRDLSTRMMRRIQGNFAFIMGFNTSLLGLGIAGIMAPQTSSVLHNLSTMGISAASMRPYLNDTQAEKKIKKGFTRGGISDRIQVVRGD